MTFKDKYTNITEKDKPENKDKVVLTDAEYLRAEQQEEMNRQLFRMAKNGR